MRKKIDCYFESGGNKFGERMKNCFSGSFRLSHKNDQIFIHIFYEDEEVLVLDCYKNPYFIARGILSSAKEVFTKVEVIKEYLSQGLVPGLDFMITDKGIVRRIPKE